MKKTRLVPCLALAVAFVLATGLAPLAGNAKADVINFSFNGLTNTTLTGTFGLAENYNGNGHVVVDEVDPIYVAYSTLGGGTTNWTFETRQPSEIGENATPGMIKTGFGEGFYLSGGLVVGADLYAEQMMILPGGFFGSIDFNYGGTNAVQGNVWGESSYNYQPGPSIQALSGFSGVTYTYVPTDSTDAVLPADQATVPEPSIYALFGIGALALVIAYRKKVA